MNRIIVVKTKIAALISLDRFKAVLVYDCKNKNNLISQKPTTKLQLIVRT